MTDRERIPNIPDDIERITIGTDRWDVEFWYLNFGWDGPDWRDMGGDYQAAKFGIAASVCEIPGASEWNEWDCYPLDNDGWVAFADNNGEHGHPQGEGLSIADAIQNALDSQ